MLAAKEFIGLLFPSIIIIAITVFLGRVFCGWLCPLGTLLDWTGPLIKPPTKSDSSIRHFKYAILIVILIASLFGLQLIGYFDPFSILVRGLTFSVDPGFNYVVAWFFDSIYFHGPTWLSAVSEPVYSFLKSTALPYKQAFFSLSLLSFIILLSIFVLEKLGKRFWCRNLCPLGALLALFSRWSFLRRLPIKSCPDCRQCAEECRMDAFENSGLLMNEECNLCMDCIYDCPESVSAFKFRLPKNKTPISLDRRVFIESSLIAITLPVFSKINASHRMPRPYLLRPPGVQGEREFLSMCVRCGECMKVCIQNALQPALMESGYEGMFSPRLIPRIGYCEFNCTLCGQVCPTGAISKLSLEEKQKFVIGRAYFNKNRCLPFSENTPCIVCEEHCPTFDKAIKFKEVLKPDGMGNDVTLKQPYVIKDLCIGCGICEKVCPIDGESAIRVMSA
jgi:ferredoxin